MKIKTQRALEVLKAHYPEVDTQVVTSLTQAVAMDCMQEIVHQVERHGRAQNAWNSIQEQFNIEVTEASLLLPFSRPDRTELYMPFREACAEQDFEAIKHILNQFIKLNYTPDDNILTELIECNNLPVFQFFIDDEFILHHETYHSMIGFERQKGTLFNMSYHYKRLSFLEYLIYEKHAEFTPEAARMLQADKSEFKPEVLSMIQNKHLNCFLTLSLEPKQEVKKPKI